MADPRVDSRPNIVMDPRTIELIERVVYDEAGGESVEGRNAVRAVIYNRIATNRRDFGGGTALGVLNAPKQFTGVMQKGNGDARNLRIPDDVREKQLQEHIEFLQRGEDPTNGATFFQNPQTAPNPYSARGGQRIGRHVFYDNYAGNKVEVPDFKVSLKGLRLPETKKPAPEEENPLIELPEEPQSPFQGMASTTPQVEEENPLVALEEPTTTPFSPLAGNQQAVPDKLAFGSPMDDMPKFAQGGLVLRLADLEDEEDEDDEDILKPLEEEEDDEDDEEDMLPKPQEEDDEDELEMSEGGLVESSKNDEDPWEKYLSKDVPETAYSDLTIGSYKPINFKKLIEAGVVRITQPGSGTGPDPIINDDPKDWSLVTKYNDEYKDSYTQKWPTKPEAYEDAIASLNAPGSLYDGKYNQIIWSARKAGLKPEDVFLEKSTGESTSSKGKEGLMGNVEEKLELSKGGVITKEPTMAKRKMKMFGGGYIDDEYDDEVEFSRGKEELEDEEEEDIPKKPKGMSDKEYAQVMKMLKVDGNAGSGMGGAIANAGKQIAAYLMKPEDSVATAIPIEMYKGGMMAPEIEITVEEESGNPVPPGSLPEEVADDVPVMMSEGEVVLPADVVRWHGLKHIMEMRAEAKHGLMCMYEEGQIQVPGEESEEEESEESEEDEEEYEGEEIEDKKQLKVLEDIVGDEELIILFRKDGSIFKN